MILIKLRDYLKEKHAASLSDMARHFDIPESAAQNMLEHWVRKGYAGSISAFRAAAVAAGAALVKARVVAAALRWFIVGGEWQRVLAFREALNNSQPFGLTVSLSNGRSPRRCAIRPSTSSG